MNGINTEWVCVHWSKAGKEVIVFATEDEAYNHSEWMSERYLQHQPPRNLNFDIEPREHIEVMPRSEWEVC